MWGCVVRAIHREQHVRDRLYGHAADPWIKGRTLRARQQREVKVEGITIAYGKRIPIGGIKKTTGYYPYHRLIGKGAMGKALPDLIDEHDICCDTFLCCHV